MPQVALALASAFATSFGVSALGITATSIFGLSAGMSFAIRAGLGIASYALSQSSRKANYGGVARGYKVTASGSALDHQIIYGETKVAGVRVYDSATGASNLYLNRVIAFAGHEIDSYGDIFINDTKVNAIDSNGFVTSIIDETGAVNSTRYAGTLEPSHIRLRLFKGTVGQSADADLVADDPLWNTTHKLSNVAYIYARFGADPNKFPGGVPEITAVIRGKKVFDPRTGLTVWSNNPCLCIRDYLTEDYGVGALTSEVDDTKVVAGANICEQVVSAESRFSLNGVFTTGAQPVDVLSSMLTSMAGTLWYSQGKWKIKPAYYTSPVMTLDESDLRSSFTVSTRHSRRDNFNTVKGTWQGDATNWQTTDYTKVTDAAYVSVDGGQESAIDLDLPFTTSHLTAQRIAQITLRGNREQLTVSANFGLRAFELEVGDVINITNSRMGWSSKNFEVVEWNFSLTSEMALEVAMSLKETSSAVYTTVAGAVFERNNTILPSPFVTGVVTALAAVGTSVFAGDGNYVGTIDVTWAAPSNQSIASFIFEYKLSTDANYSSRSILNSSYRLMPVSDNSTYNIRVRAVNSLGIQGPTSSITFVTSADTTAPASVSFNSATGVYKAVELRWNNPTAKDFKEVLIYVNSVNSSVGSTLIAKLSTTYYSHNLQPNNTTNFYFIRSSDRTGNLSAYSAGVSATTLAGLPTVDLSGVLDIDQFAASIRPVEVLGVLPTTGNFSGRMVFLTTNDKLYRHTGSPAGSAGFTLAVDGNDITANSIVAGKIAAGAISTTELAAGAATIGKLSIVDFQNRVENPGFELGNVGWTGIGGAGNWEVVANPRTGVNAVRRAYTGVASSLALNNDFRFSAEPTKQYLAKCWVRGSAYAGGTGGIRIRWLNAAGGTISLDNAVMAVPATYTLVSQTLTAPALAAWGEVELVVFSQTAGTIFIDDIFVGEKNAGELIVDGTVTANHMAANSITVGNAAIGNAVVDTLQIAGQAVTVTQNAFSSTNIAVTQTPTYTDLLSLTFTRESGFQTYITFSVAFDSAAIAGGNFQDGVYLWLLRGGTGLYNELVHTWFPTGSSLRIPTRNFSFVDTDMTGGSTTYTLRVAKVGTTVITTSYQTMQAQQFKR